MFHLVLFQPEIPPNTGNIIRLCANTQCTLHLIKPLGFSLEDKHVKRAGLDYHHLAQIQIHDHINNCLNLFPQDRCFALTTKGARFYHEPHFQPNDVFIFGPETRGLPQTLLDQFEASQRLKIPQASHSRSLNLSNAAAIMIYEAWRQNHYHSL